ncbi:MAG TPA: molybdopterin cofactor-binding domain-containing protein [Acidocella sp.]|jgi:isoquinoline 1-oxidoreductase beta subunit|uniref:xanthine dehydrogenase family protein molybdopterin-binding subunit n=1 Tax=Acidocella sp. TaxID=50710 RepID=UPI002BB6B6A5|nr:molybdopterin cofactor-binding domain-containing protein [Acidocella sp.]HVE21422.1 molybdopterin cofactor-binding domain-containing protein [Acidocella sp.]
MSYEAPSRRLVLKAGLLAGGGLLLSLHLPRAARAAETPHGAEPAPFVPNAFIEVPPTGKIIFISPHTEAGQGIYTSTAMLMAEELYLGLDQIAIQPAPPDLAKYKDPLLGDQATGGSASTRADWLRLRQAAAAARIMLVGAAAARWHVDPAACQVARGVISHAGSGRTLTYGEVAGDAAGQKVPAHIPLKPASQFTLIGTSAPRLDTPAKVNGTAQFGIDTILPGMRIGTLAITPVRGGTVATMDIAAAHQVAGVHDIVVAPDKSAVAVFGDHMWAAKQGLAALNITWAPGPNGSVTTAALIDALDQASQHQGVIAKHTGNATGAISAAATKLDAVYQLPFLSHAPMEPLNCTLHIQPDQAEIWVGTQVPVRAQKAVATATGLPQDKVTVNNLYMGGAFGRRLDIDSIEIAAALAKQVSYPVKLVWTREEDTRHDYYRPYYYDRVSAGLDEHGKLVGWTHRVTGSSVMARWAPAGFVNGLDPDAVECAANTPYDVPAEFVDYVRHEPQGVGTGWWRGVGPTHNVFVVESFVDEIASAAKRDPVEFRRSMLQHNPRALAVLNLAAEKSGWGTPLPAGTGRGIEVQFAFGSYLSLVMEVSVTPQGEIVLKRAVVAVDCGSTINPDTVQAQIQGGLILGLGTALYDEITFADGAVRQSNFHDYRTLRMNETPVIEVYQIRNEEAPGGIGETGTAAAAPALANAIFAATGKRLRRMPFGAGQLVA